MTMAATKQDWHRMVFTYIFVVNSLCSGSDIIPRQSYTCPRNLTECDCPTTKLLLFNCSPSQSQKFSYTLLYDIAESQLTMDCTSPEQDYHLLKFNDFQFPRVDTFIMNNCPLPNGSIGSLLEELNITKLKISPSSTGDILNSTLFQNLSQIVQLDIEGGHIKDIENGSFKDLPSLRSLKISQNMLTNLPAYIFHEMPSLLSLNLDNNMIEGLPNHAFEKLPQLQNLSLNNNHIKSLDDSVFQNLVNLSVLEIRNNLVDTIGSNIFKNLAQLEILDLTYNQLSELDDSLFENNHQLRQLFLKMNDVLTKLPATLFQNTVLLQRLELDQNNLTELPPNIFSALPNLSILNLSKNRLTTLPKELFNNTTKLTEIDLSVNQLAELPGDLFRPITDLKVVRLYNNKLTSLSRLSFYSMPSLEVIDLSNNEISVIDEHAFDDSDNITSLDLSYNNINFITDVFSVPQNLKYLNLSHNNLTNFPEHEWNNLPDILQINLTNNHLKSVNILQLMFKSDKVTVDMRRNEIQVVNLLNMDKYFTPSTKKPDVPSTAAIPNIFIEQNPINCDCNLLSFVRYVKRYNNDPDAPFHFQANSLECSSPNDPMLFRRKISSLSEDNLYCLVEESCDKHCVCKRSSVSKTLTVDCNLGSNNATLLEIPKTAPVNTSKLLLQNNNISSLSALKERIWRNLTEVYLSGNILTLDDIPVDLPPRLRLLALSNNKIESMPQWLMTEVSYRDDLSVTLGGNPWRCDCTAVKFHQWLSELPSGKVSDPSGIRCSNGLHENEKLLKLRLSKLCVHHRAGPGGPILVTVFSALVLLGVAVIAGVLLTRNRHRIKMWCFRHKMCLWMRTQDDIEAGHPL